MDDDTATHNDDTTGDEAMDDDTATAKGSKKTKGTETASKSSGKLTKTKISSPSMSKKSSLDDEDKSSYKLSKRRR